MHPAGPIAAAAAFWLWCSVAAAGPYVKITQPAGKDGAGTGCSSGTLIGWTVDLKDGIFISCGHGYDPLRAVEVEIDQHRTVAGRIIAINRDFDLSLVAAPIDRSNGIVRLADRAPRECGAVGLIGFPDKKFQHCETCISGRFWSKGACTTKWALFEASARCPRPAEYQELLVTAAASAPGLSGGAMLHDRKLAGVVIGRITNARDAGLVVPAETVRHFVRRNISLFYRR
ncbi:MAG: hypothetical protein HY290_21945 [Planctomycetia bacterium]|nr:hypothetical protein [Planctomycetia bacterium]